MAPFSVIVFGGWGGGGVVWTIAVPGAEQLRFRLKTDYCGRGLDFHFNTLPSFHLFSIQTKTKHKILLIPYLNFLILYSYIELASPNVVGNT